jgi:hypothetical protein
MKWWPGNLGKTATHCLVYANLILHGEEKGFHVFMCAVHACHTHNLTRTHAQTHTHTDTHTHTHKRAHARARTHTRAHAHTRTRTRTRTHTHAYPPTYALTHARAQGAAPRREPRAAAGRRGRRGRREGTHRVLKGTHGYSPGTHRVTHRVIQSARSTRGCSRGTHGVLMGYSRVLEGYSRVLEGYSRGTHGVLTGTRGVLKGYSWGTRWCRRASRSATKVCVANRVDFESTAVAARRRSIFTDTSACVATTTAALDVATGRFTKRCHRPRGRGCLGALHGVL